MCVPKEVFTSKIKMRLKKKEREENKEKQQLSNQKLKQHLCSPNSQSILHVFKKMQRIHFCWAVLSDKHFLM
jgi:hypothetical protein